jgi:hypothetical protein
MMIAIHQPNFIPWLGYFYKMACADQFVFADSVQFTKGSFINRNRIKTKSGPTWLTVPVLTSGRFAQDIYDVEIVNDRNWTRKHLAVISDNYRQARYFHEVFPLLESVYSQVTQELLLVSINIAFIRCLCSYLDLQPVFIRASELCVNGHGSQFLQQICQRLGADRYLAGSGARNYQDDRYLISAGIQPVYSDFRAEKYPQMGNGFIENLSIVDAVMNCGTSVRQLITPRVLTRG